MEKIIFNGMITDMDTLAEYMDQDIREALHAELAPCTPEKFLEAYIAAHKEKYGEDFTI